MPIFQLAQKSILLSKSGNMINNVYKQVQDHVTKLFEANKKPKLIFHSLEHTLEIVKRTEEIAAHGYVLTPGRYVGAEEVEDEAEPFEEKMKRLKADLEKEFSESEKLEQQIRSSLERLNL